MKSNTKPRLTLKPKKSRTIPRLPKELPKLFVPLTPATSAIEMASALDMTSALEPPLEPEPARVQRVISEPAEPAEAESFREGACKRRKFVNSTTDEQHSFASDFTSRGLKYVLRASKNIRDSAAYYRKAVSDHHAAITSTISEPPSWNNPDAVIEFATRLKTCAHNLKKEERHHEKTVRDLDYELALFEKNCDKLVTYYFKRSDEYAEIEHKYSEIAKERTSLMVTLSEKDDEITKLNREVAMRDNELRSLRDNVKYFTQRMQPSL